MYTDYKLPFTVDQNGAIWDADGASIAAESNDSGYLVHCSNNFPEALRLLEMLHYHCEKGHDVSKRKLDVIKEFIDYVKTNGSSKESTEENTGVLHGS